MELEKIAKQGQENTDLPYLLFRIGKNIYGISSEFVRGIETLGEVTSVVGSAPNIRGGLIYKDDFIYLVDMRKLFGLDSQIEEFENEVQLEQRIQDHKNWMAALEKSVQENTEFTLADDPHQCAFGKWLYSFRTDNNDLKYQLNKLEVPHKAVHDVAKRVKQLMQEDNCELAMSAIQELRDTHYKTTLRRLSSLREIVATNLKELFIMVESGDYMKGLIVDAIVDIEYLNNTLHTHEPVSYSRYIKFLGQRKEDKTIVIILDSSIVEYE